ncbi:MAG: rod shape-determining protein RodA [Xanthomonadaceae bacterium]|nr:rod shape-determining protein RodA [Rhodospirillaceae bacterium]NIA17894.1 rod shape-determining protein RodA [Xanthomonadaceae bacterium]
MLSFSTKNLYRFNWGLLTITLILISFSLLILYSLDLGNENNLFFFKKQLAFVGLGILLFFVFNAIDYKIFKTYSYWIYLFSLFLLTAVLFFGKSIHGTQGWFVIGNFQFQPVEISKIALIIVLSRFFSIKAYEIKTIQFITLSGILLAPSLILVMRQPDLGSAIILFILWFGMLLVSGIKKKHLFFISLSLITIFIFAWFFGLQEYQKARILTFLNPSSDPLKTGYNVIQSKIAIGSGQIFGRGFSFGTQSQLNFLPEAHTDFILSSLAESLGFLGITLILFFYGLFFYIIIKKLKTVYDDFGIFLIIGILIYFISQIFLNIAMNIGMAPVIGIPLPLLSYGGSSLIITFIMLGIVSSVLTKNRYG